MRRYSAADIALLTQRGLEAQLPPPRQKRPRNNEESRSQIAVFQWWAVAHRNFGLPACLLHSIPNGALRNVITATILKREGLVSGVFDIKLNVARGGYHGAWVEMKAEKGCLSDAQKDFNAAVSRQGYFTATCHSAQAAIDVITLYLNS